MRQDGCAEFISASLSLPRYHGEGGPRSGGRGTKKGAAARVYDFVQQPLCICPYGAIGASRTRDPLLRRQMLYPSELQPQELLEFTKNTRKVQAVPRLHPQKRRQSTKRDTGRNVLLRPVSLIMSCRCSTQAS